MGGATTETGGCPSLAAARDECGGTLEVRTGQGVQSCSVAGQGQVQSNPASRIRRPQGRAEQSTVAVLGSSKQREPSAPERAEGRRAAGRRAEKPN